MNNNTCMFDIISPFLKNRYEVLRNVFFEIFENVYASDFQNCRMDLPDILVDAVPPRYKVLTHIFIQEHFSNICRNL